MDCSRKPADIPDGLPSGYALANALGPPIWIRHGVGYTADDDPVTRQNAHRHLGSLVSPLPSHSHGSVRCRSGVSRRSLQRRKPPSRARNLRSFAGTDDLRRGSMVARDCTSPGSVGRGRQRLRDRYARITRDETVGAPSRRSSLGYPPRGPLPHNV